MPYIKFANLHKFICKSDPVCEINNLKQSVVSVYLRGPYEGETNYITYHDDMKHGLYVEISSNGYRNTHIEIYYRNVLHGEAIYFNNKKGYPTLIQKIMYWHSKPITNNYRTEKKANRHHTTYKKGFGYADYLNGKKHGTCCFCVYYRGIEHMQFTRFFRGIIHGTMRIYRDKKLAMYAVYKLGRCLYKYYYNIDDVIERQAKIRSVFAGPAHYQFNKMKYLDVKNYVAGIDDLPHVDPAAKQLVAIAIYTNFKGGHENTRKAYLIDKKYRKYLHYVKNSLYHHEDYVQYTEYFYHG